MKIRKDILNIRAGLRDDVGERIEPEQQLVQRVIDAPAATTASHSGQQVGTMRSEIVVSSSAAEVAAVVKTPCWSCKHFDRETWLKVKSKAEGPLGSQEDRKFLNKIRAALLDSGNAELHERHVSQEGDMDVEHALAHLGVCRPLTEMDNDMVVVYPLATCPASTVTATQPNGLYEAKDKEAKRAGSAAYDMVMKRAAGIVP